MPNKELSNAIIAAAEEIEDEIDDENLDDEKED